MYNFQEANHIFSRRIAKFVTRNTSEEVKKLKQIPQNFIKKLEPPITQNGLKMYTSQMKVDVCFVNNS